MGCSVPWNNEVVGWLGSWQPMNEGRKGCPHQEVPSLCNGKVGGIGKWTSDEQSTLV